MKGFRLVFVLLLVGAVGAAVVWRDLADAQAQTIKIGVLFDQSGPFAAGGSLNCWRGAKMIIDYVNEHGGVLGKYKLVRVCGDSQSKADVAIHEVQARLNAG